MALNLTPFTFLLLAAVISTSTSAATIAVTPTNPSTVCAIVANQPTQYIKCFHRNQTTSILPTFSFESISAGNHLLCGLVSGGLTLFCWDIKIDDRGYANFHLRRLYHNDTIALTDLTVSITDHVCAREVDSGTVKCWRGVRFSGPDSGLSFTTITFGDDFLCGILKNDSTVYCWGYDSVTIQSQFAGLKMDSLVASKTHKHVCGHTYSGELICKGNNESGQLDVPVNSNFDLFSVAVGSDFNCAIEKYKLTCWGIGVDRVGLNNIGGLALRRFVSVIVSSDYVCGLDDNNLKVSCWGIGWPDFGSDLIEIPLGEVIPGPCVESCPCDNTFTCPSGGCKLITGSWTWCSGNGVICEPCPNSVASF